MTFREQRAIEILKSLVEISVSGFRTLALLNGGGCIALVTYLSRDNPVLELTAVHAARSLVAYVLGLVFCMCAYFTSHGTQLALYDEAIHNLNDPARPVTESHRTWLTVARVLVILSTLAFLIGSGIAVYGFAAADALPTSRDKQSYTAESKSTETKQSQTVPTPPVIVGNDPRTQQKQRAANAESAYWPPIWSNWALFFAALVAAGIALRTLGAVSDQATATKENVIATRQLANLERPWVLIYPADPEAWPSANDAVPLSFVTGTLVSEINYGRSPAFVKRVSISLRILDWPLPNTRPDYTSADDVPPLFLAPNGERPHTVRMSIRISGEEFREICQGNKCLTLYGYVEYEDTINKDSHITRFCSSWFYREDGIRIFRPVGPESWIEYT